MFKMLIIKEIDVLYASGNISFFVFLKTPFSCVLLHFLSCLCSAFSCKYVNIIAQNNHFRPYKSAFYLSNFALLRDEKCLLRHIFALKNTFPLNNVIKFGS